MRNRVGILIAHLLKWQYQPDKRSKSGQATLREQRREILQLLQESPSLKSYLPEAISYAYEAAKDLVVRETPLDYSDLPETCPHRGEQLFDSLFPFAT